MRSPVAGCVAAVYFVDRPQMEHVAMNATGDAMRTDGSLAAVQLKDCETAVFERQAADAAALAGSRPHSKFARYVRMQVLSFKSDVVRGNIVYGVFDLTRMAIRARRNHTQRVELARQVATTPEPRAEVASGASSPVLSWSDGGE